MIDRDKRRRLVHLLVGINGAGFVLCGTFLSGAFKDGYVPWFGLAGIVILFFGVVVPSTLNSWHSAWALKTSNERPLKPSNVDVATRSPSTR